MRSTTDVLIVYFLQKIPSNVLVNRLNAKQLYPVESWYAIRAQSFSACSLLFHIGNNSNNSNRCANYKYSLQLLLHLQCLGRSLFSFSFSVIVFVVALLLHARLIRRCESKQLQHILQHFLRICKVCVFFLSFLIFFSRPHAALIAHLIFASVKQPACVCYRYRNNNKNQNKKQKTTNLRSSNTFAIFIIVINATSII